MSHKILLTSFRKYENTKNSRINYFSLIYLFITSFTDNQIIVKNIWFSNFDNFFMYMLYVNAVYGYNWIGFRFSRFGYGCGLEFGVAVRTVHTVLYVNAVYMDLDYFRRL